MLQIHGEACPLGLKPLVAPLTNALKHFQKVALATPMLSRLYLRLILHQPSLTRS